MTSTAETPPAPRRTWLRVILFVIAVLEFLRGLQNLNYLSGDSAEILEATGVALPMRIALACMPLLAIAGFVFVWRRELARAIMALAAIAIVTWLAYLPSVVTGGLDLAMDGATAFLVVETAILPLMAAVAIVLARQGERLGLATALVALPTVIGFVGFVIFALGVMRYGF